MTSSEVLKARHSTREKKIPNRVGAMTQPCLTPLLVAKAFETALSFFVLPGAVFQSTCQAKILSSKHPLKQVDRGGTAPLLTGGCPA